MRRRTGETNLSGRIRAADLIHYDDGVQCWKVPAVEKTIALPPRPQV